MRYDFCLRCLPWVVFATWDKKRFGSVAHFSGALKFGKSLGYTPGNTVFLKASYTCETLAQSESGFLNDSRTNYYDP